jgi:hypothetical protein
MCNILNIAPVFEGDKLSFLMLENPFWWLSYAPFGIIGRCLDSLGALLPVFGY